jgi:hypothetical protein
MSEHGLGSERLEVRLERVEGQERVWRQGGYDVRAFAGGERGQVKDSREANFSALDAPERLLSGSEVLGIAEHRVAQQISNATLGYCLMGWD